MLCLFVCLFVFAENKIYKPEIHEAERLTYKREGGKTQEVPTDFLWRGGISRIFIKIPHRNLKFQNVVGDILHSFNIYSHHWSYLTDISTKKSTKMLIKVKVRSVILNDLRLVLLLLTHCLCWIRWNHLLNNVFVFLSQTLTGKEIEIDIEPTDKVHVYLFWCAQIVSRCVFQCILIHVHPGGAD